MLERRTVLALMLGGLAHRLPGASAPLRVLIVDGMNNHDWPRLTRQLRHILMSSGLFQVEVSTTPPAAEPQSAWQAWRPEFSRYDVVVNNFNGGHTKDGVRWPRQVEQGLEQYVERGGGLVIVHSANNGFLEWPAFNRMIGLGWRDRSFGPGLIVGEDRRIARIPPGEGLNPGHGPAHDFVIRVLDRRHPITRGMPEQWLHPHEQLTHGQHGPAERMHVLTYAWSKDSKQNEPMDWVIPFGKGRVYTTMLGHTWKDEDNPNVRCVGFQTLLIRGTEWAARAKVSYPIPADFPSTERASLRATE
jgi:uncharacterized protein